jgi:hypothetical protein
MSKNPFEYDAAPNISPELLVKWFIEDNNFSRFVQSTRNVLINGERGSGKSMALIYNSISYQKIRQTLKNEPFPHAHIGFYIPCNTALTHKQEYLLLPEVEQAITSEHFLAYGICGSIAKDCLAIADDFSADDNQLLFDEFSYVFGEPPVNEKNPFIYLRRLIRSRLRKDQERLAIGASVETPFEPTSFYTFVLPILEGLKNTSLLKDSHISLLIDDAHDLNSHQKKILNSWLGYRDHSVFSLKVAIAGIRTYDLRTAFGGTILEGHDYITVDLEQPFQNKESGFGKFARQVIQRRLENVGIEISPEEFFPESEAFVKAMSECNQTAKKRALEKGIPESDTKAINDFIFKYSRAIYFGERSPKAARPTYAGFDTLVHLSTGVIRNLLDPCYWMFEEYQSTLNNNVLVSIPTDIQSKVVHDRSATWWEFVRNKLDTQVEGCGKSESDKLKNLFTMLAEHFKYRLKNHKSEPRVLTFVISQLTDEAKSELDPILRLAQKAQLLYVRNGRSKDGGGREDFFTPNRILWPEYGLDVHGQHGRASLKASDLINAMQGIKIPSSLELLEDAKQKDLFYE